MRTLIADDHDLVRIGLKVVLQKLAPDCTIIECTDFIRASEVAATGQKIDLAIFDLQMPGMKGATSVENFCSQYPDTRVIILSGRYKADDVWETLERGAAGFIPKSMGSEAMLNALHLVMAGERFIPSDILFAFGGEKALGNIVPMGSKNGIIHRLTRRENHVLSELIKGLPNKRIGANLGIEEVTVKLHLRNIYRKLGACSRTQAVTMALHAGWDGLQQQDYSVSK